MNLSFVLTNESFKTEGNGKLQRNKRPRGLEAKRQNKIGAHLKILQSACGTSLWPAHYIWNAPLHSQEKEKKHKGRGGGIEIEKCPHYNIKVVEILRYCRLSSVVELVSYIVKNVVALDKIVIDPARNWGFHGTISNKSIAEIKLEEEARDHAVHFIKKELSSSVEFFCL
ncbi:hypothetical protein ACLB2K_071881 [Fragaria x ananassa]